MMNDQLMQISLFALCVLEVVLCYVFVSHMVRIRIKPVKFEWVWVIVGVAIVGCALRFYRNILFFADNVWTGSMVFGCIWMVLLFRKNIIETVELVILYFSTVALLDFCFGFLVLDYLQEQFWNKVYFMTLSWWSVLIYGLSRIVLLGIYLLMRKYLSSEFRVKECRIIFLFAAVGVCVLVKFYRWTLLYLAENAPVAKMDGVWISVLTILALLCVMLLLFFRAKVVQQEKDIIMIKCETQEKQFHEIQEITEQNQSLVHDMKNHIMILQELAQKEDISGINTYLQQIADGSTALIHQKWTGCKILDLLLNQKQREALQDGIEFLVVSTGTVKIGLPENELVSLFGNLLDNAIEACQKIQAGKKEIKTIIERKNDMVFVKISNTVLHEPVMKDGELITTKADKGRHGYGLKNVKRIVEKNGGQIQFKMDEKVFSVCVTFFEN
ncbi:MAG: GHKL domain-containing protein [Agathobacter sp.]